MTQIKFSKNGGGLSLLFKVNGGVLAAICFIKLSDGKGNIIATFRKDYSGVSLVEFVLARPASELDDVLITWTVDYQGLDVNSTAYNISLEFRQDNKSLGELTKTGNLTMNQDDFFDFITLNG